MPAKAPQASRHREVERKFDVGESTVSPSFEGIAAVAHVDKPPTQTLDATYFDTPAQDLARNKITLRRRTGGSDAGWHLKLPTGPEARTEVRVPLDASDTDTVPEELVDVVLAIVRDSPLVPVARITTQRESQVLYSADGAPLAEFSNDHVTAWSARTSEDADLEPTQQEWREWELELAEKNGAPDTELLNRLGNRLLDAGAAPAGHASKLARVLGTTPQPDSAQPAEHPLQRAVAEQIRELLVWDRAVRADAFDSIHQMRVTTRKLRSLLRDYQESFGLPDDGWVLDELRELAGILGIARDAEVLAERYERQLDRLTPDLVRGPVHERLVGGAQRRYQTGLRRSLMAMRSQRYFRLLDALDAIAVQPPGSASDEEHAPVTIDAAYKKVRKAAKAAAQVYRDHPDDQHQRDEAVHRIRKRAKRLRYTAAATGEDKVSEQSKAVQSLLGDHQDSVVSREHLRHESEAAHTAGEDTFTYGLLYQQEADLAERCEQQLDDALRKLAKAVRKARH
ncbi:CHAD domain-containing protein [Mycobacterium sp. 852002-51613_SCH5001154]|uniref:CYTH and CHAD domain-containing protein n=1 Tax=unclassified Mycobacterium TaxID=2642494 RepID=UPI0007FD8108|nr:MULTISPECIES: CYTH and CHAD domain-containing protein [unclassified Mycobacterium]OBF71830.1 CHAD domain-containing protein [Mycobacterium sp. 852002-51613_SCH5001154]OBF93026.1 CHAD domain-containing protein [Mycobacterium sp. 852014-52450_SCH5900713]